MAGSALPGVRRLVLATPSGARRGDTVDPGRVSYLTQTAPAVDETEDVVAALRRLGPVTVTERVTAVEDTHFNPPPIGDPR